MEMTLIPGIMNLEKGENAGCISKGFGEIKRN